MSNFILQDCFLGLGNNNKKEEEKKKKLHNLLLAKKNYGKISGIIMPDLTFSQTNKLYTWVDPNNSYCRLQVGRRWEYLRIFPTSAGPNRFNCLC